MTTTVLLGLFVAIVGPFLADEMKAWCCWLHKKLRQMAVAKLPEGNRARYDEEWESALQEIPGEIFKLIYSVGLLRAGVRIRSVALENALNFERPFPLLFKRMLDIMFSSMALFLLSPVLLTIAILIKLDSPGPLLYVSERVGKNGRVFRCLKLRTMALDAEKWRADVLPIMERDSGVFKIPNAFRITPLGRLLRKYSLDELPLFINVLLGDMSLVGPRPPLASEVKDDKINRLHRLDVNPGITGLWQVQTRQDPSLDTPKSLDEKYLENWSIWLDLKIIVQTVGCVFTFRRKKDTK